MFFSERSERFFEQHWSFVVFFFVWNRTFEGRESEYKMRIRGNHPCNTFHNEKSLVVTMTNFIWWPIFELQKKFKETARASVLRSLHHRVKFKRGGSPTKARSLLSQIQPRRYNVGVLSSQAMLLLTWLKSWFNIHSTNQIFLPESRWSSSKIPGIGCCDPRIFSIPLNRGWLLVGTATPPPVLKRSLRSIAIFFFTEVFKLL